jgi:hypothetical protein
MTTAKQNRGGTLGATAASALTFGQIARRRHASTKIRMQAPYQISTFGISSI